MKKINVALIVLWSVIGLLIIGMMAVGIGVSQWGWSSRSTRERYVPSGDMELLLDETVDLSGITLLELEFWADDVEIMPSEDNQLRVVQYGQNLAENQHLKVTKTSSTVRVGIETRSFTISDFSFNWLGGWGNGKNWGRSESNVTVYLPADYNRSMSVTLGSGEIHVNTALALDDLGLELFSGRIRSEEGIAAGHAAIEVMSGNMALASLHTDSFTAEVFSGRLEIGEASGNAVLELSSGRINVDSLTTADTLRTEVFSGTLSVGIAGDPSIQFQGEKFSGKLDTYFEKYSKEERSFEYFATVGEGPYLQIESSVSSGTTRLYQA